jgi:hypothetical protein
LDDDPDDTHSKYFILKFHTFENLAETFESGVWNDKVTIKRSLWGACKKAEVTVIWTMSGSRYYCGYASVEGDIDLEGLDDMSDEDLRNKVG